MSNLFHYRAIVEDGVNKLTYRSHGVIAAEDYGEAAKLVTEYYNYGNNYFISTVAIEEWENPCELGDGDIDVNYYKERHCSDGEPVIKLEV